jgi:hypothetical protein
MSELLLVGERWLSIPLKELSTARIVTYTLSDIVPPRGIHTLGLASVAVLISFTTPWVGRATESVGQSRHRLILPLASQPTSPAKQLPR